MLVAFKNLNDPLSAERIVDSNSCADPKTELRIKSNCTDKNHFTEVFGNGVKLKEIYLEKTDENFSPHIQKFLKWLPEKYGRQLDGNSIQLLGSKYSVANSLSVGSFTTEVGKK